MSAQVTPERPWLGLRYFSEDERDYFFGRMAEMDDLFERVLHKPLTILFGQSGLGKTSLLRAGLIPRLRASGFTPVLIRLDHDADAPPYEQQALAELAAALLPAMPALPDAAASASGDGGASPGGGDDRGERGAAAAATLWEFFHDPLCGFLSPDGQPQAQPVLIFDQFEEIFTLGQARQADAAAFREALSGLVENRIPEAIRLAMDEDDALAERLVTTLRPCKVLLALREDFLHQLERWRRAMPSLMENRMELRLLTGPQALDAVVEPGRLRCAAQPGLPPIVNPQTGAAIVRFIAGAAADVPLAEIDAVPPLLSLLCAELNAQRGDSPVIRTEQLGGQAEDILRQFYERCFTPHPPAVRAFVEDRLLSPEGFRQNANEDTFLHEMAAAGLPGPDARRVLRRLVDDRLLVSEERGGVRRIELTHDTLTGVARRSRDLRHQSEAAARRRRLRNRWLAATAGLMLLVTGISVPLAVWALRERANLENANENLRRERDRAEANERAAEAAKTEADKQRKQAENMRKRSESLVGLLTFIEKDLGSALESIGRTDLLAEFENRLADYRDRYLDALPQTGTLDNQLADILSRAKRLVVTGDSAGALQLTVQGIKIAQEEMKKSTDNSFAVRLKLARLMRVQGEILLSQGNLRQAEQQIREALTLLHKQSLADPADAVCQNDISVAYYCLGDVLRAQGQLSEALKAYRDSLAIAERLAKADPDNAGWQRDLSVSYDRVGDVLRAQGQLSEALKAYRDSLAICERLAKADPDNAGWQRDLATSCGKVGNVAQREKRWAEAADSFAREIEIARAWLEKDDADVRWLSIFTYGTGSCREVLRDAPKGAVILDRAKMLADLRTARDRLRRLKEQNRLVPPMDNQLPWIEGLLAEAEAKKP